MLMRIVVVALFLVFASSAANASKRVALVIGNSAYKHASELTNPRNDAADISTVLKQRGFEVIDGFDLDKPTFDRKVRDFAAALSGADVGLFFYAGHGLQVGGQNYLVPVDAELITASALDWEMVRLDLVQRTMEREASTNVIFLDACRDNPLSRNLARAMGTRSAEIGHGLAPTEAGIGTLISFSTQPGNVALDGTGRNSPFAEALIKQIATSNDDLSRVLIAVRNDVIEATKTKQVPWEHSALRGPFYFNITINVSPVAPSTAVQGLRLSEAAEAWDRTKDTNSIAALEMFIAGYKETYYAGLARLRIEELMKRQTSVATEAIPPLAPSPSAGASRNPFGVGDVSDPYGEDVRQFASRIRLPGGSGDQNAAQWSPSVTAGKPGSLDGEWFGRWEFGSAGTGRIKVVGNRFYVLYSDQAGRMTGKSWILEAIVESRDRLVGRWAQVGRPSDTGPFVGLIVGDDRIDGIWNWGGTGRWDFRRKLKR